jgi:prepilin-type N-terminal cleavage/methylation domain-containing protein
MKPIAHPRRPLGFTLIEVLISLGLCALLAASVVSAATFALRAQDRALRDAEDSLLLATLYAAQRLRPADEPPLPAGRLAERTSTLVALPDSAPRTWTQIDVRDARRNHPLFALRILETPP